MMFTRFAALALAALPALAAATPVLESRGGGGGGNNGSSCSTGSLKCCNQVQDVSSSLLMSETLPLIDHLQASEPGAASLLGLLGLTGKVTGQVGIQCSPISAIGIANGGDCKATVACCQNNNEVSILGTDTSLFPKTDLCLSGRPRFHGLHPRQSVKVPTIWPWLCRQRHGRSYLAVKRTFWGFRVFCVLSPVHRFTLWGTARGNSIRLLAMIAMLPSFCTTYTVHGNRTLLG